MSLLMRTSLVAVLGMAFTSCGGGDGNDEDAIRDVFRDFYSAFENEDVAQLAGLLGDNCEETDQIAQVAIASYNQQTSDGDIEFDVTGAEFSELDETKAEARPVGTARTPDGEFPIGDESSAYASLEKVEGEWKLTDCNIRF